MSRASSVRVAQSGRSQLLRYGVVGVASNLLGYGAYLLLTGSGATPKITMTLLYVVGVAVGYVGNRRLTFDYHGGHRGPVARYLVAHLLGYLLNFSALWLFVDRLGWPHQIVQALAIPLVAVFLFVALRHFVFGGSSVCVAGLK